MTDLASKVAGTRLSGILAALLLPLLLLGFLVVDSLRKDINFTETELRGLRVASVAMPLILDKVSGQTDKLAIENSVATILTDAKVLNIAEALDGFTEQLKSPIESEQDLDALADFMHDVGTHSKLLLDPEAESFFLALTAINNLPDLVSDIDELARTLETSLASGGIDSNELKRIMELAGRAGEAVERALDSQKHALEFGRNTDAYLASNELMQRLKRNLSVMVETVSGLDTGQESIALRMFATQNLAVAEKFKLSRVMWQQTSNRLGEVLQARLADHYKTLYSSIMVALACVFVALGGSYLLFGSTLKKLDLVDAERQRANDARDEAEAMGRKVAVFNDDLTKLNRDLANNVQSLKQAQDELVKKGRMEQLGQLTATIAHEIRNPLGAVRTSAFLLERKISGKGLGVEAQIERINKGVVRCDDIITQLLDYSRTKEVNTVAADLDEWLVGIVREQVQRMPAAVFVECSLGLNGKPVHFDGSRLQRGLINLLTNACEAMGAGDANADKAAGRFTISVSSMIRGEFAAIRVSDNGPGIAPEILAKIREPLFTTKSFGTGLGIPAVEQIAAQHGGTLEIESAPGKGAAFTILIPLNPVQREAA